MSGTITSPSVLMSSEYQDNTSGLITPAFGRNMIETWAGVATSSITTNYTPVYTDRGTLIRANFSTAGQVLITINTGVFLAGNQFAVRWVGTLAPTIVAGTGVTLISQTQGTGNQIFKGATGQIAIVTCDTVSNTFYVDGV